MGTASYIVGPSDFFTPGDLKKDADTVDSQVRLLDEATNGNEEIPQQSWDAWQLFMSHWREFYSSSFGGFFQNFATAVNDSNRDQLISYENQFVSWTKELGQYGATIPGAVIAPSEGAGDTIKKQLENQLGGLGISVDVALVVVLAIIIVWKVWK